MRGWALALIAAASASAALCDPAPPTSPIDLAKPFHTRSPWRLTYQHGPQTEDFGGNPAPGALSFCLQKTPASPCLSAAVSAMPPQSDKWSVPWEAHYLEAASPIYPQGPGTAPLLQIVTSSLHAGDGGQVRVLQILKYDRAADSFGRVYFHSTGSNNNQEMRVVADGPLRGAVISADPTENAPYGFWIAVNQLTPQGAYRQTLRYRSATRYNDGNPLAVIDSEMPNLQQRLGVWKPGSPLPLPANKACPRPHLKQRELWCD
jgi:hypothetical protein